MLCRINFFKQKTSHNYPVAPHSSIIQGFGGATENDLLDPITTLMEGGANEFAIAVTDSEFSRVLESKPDDDAYHYALMTFIYISLCSQLCLLFT